MPSLKTIFDAVAVPVVGLNHELCVVMANQEARKTFANIEEGVVFPENLAKNGNLSKKLKKTLETGNETTATIVINEGFGREFRTLIRAVSTKAANNDISLVLTFEDRTTLQDVKAMRSDFVANVSHEIRSPLTAISGFVETLQGAARNDPEARAMFLGLMEKEVTRMTNLVRDLLSLSRVEVKERRAPKKTVKPDQVIRQALESAQTFAEKHGKTLDVHVDDALPEILGNHNDLVRILINLLENAVTYSREAGVIQMRAGLAEKTNPLGKKAICIAVRDQGEGIPASEIPHLTKRFYRVDKSRSRNAGGTGLGLAIVKHILVRHRGKLEIDSTLDEGSEFRVYLPVLKQRK